MESTYSIDGQRSASLFGKDITAVFKNSLVKQTIHFRTVIFKFIDLGPLLSIERSACSRPLSYLNITVLCDAGIT